ncbi:hypothetical protein SmJEL517_g03972 [Synchytrium microbalum]|uniref:Ribosomal protein S3 C-terminal domain-containing protein n=1 Tax=Synchytrium microbalum TaxID=1806994 RepID=A0A507C6D1_9FUNG|nr:uncharacterized protein SmJEL517_g03972 [Synchytrium microbalum]TPX33035.1 hypothetical protein SmJEL517_g03972 [Synchytrium microbalum]
MSKTIRSLSVYKNFLNELARLSAKAPRVTTMQAPLARPPKNLNMHLYKRHPFPGIPNHPPGSRQDMWERFLKIKSEQYCNRKAKAATASLDDGLDSAADEAFEEIDDAAIDRAIQDASLSSEQPSELASEGITESNTPVESTLIDPVVEGGDALITSDEIAYVEDIPLPRVLQRHIMKPNQQLTSASPLGKVVGYRIQVSGRKTTRTVTDTVRYGRLSTGQQGTSYVDFGKTSYVTRRGVTGVKVWIAYAT